LKYIFDKRSRYTVIDSFDFTCHLEQSITMCRTYFYPHQAINPEFLSSQNLFRNG
ncbi:hypothetical protein S245_016121, partial [Arachis hypogaea]